MKLNLLLIILLAGICGCAESPERHLNRVHKQMLKNSTPSYAEGYKDGCASGYAMAGDQTYVFRKNALRTQQDTLYSRGWREGHQTCHREAVRKKASKERFHNRLYHGKSDYRSEHKRYTPSTEEQEAIWETLKK